MHRLVPTGANQAKAQLVETDLVANPRLLALHAAIVEETAIGGVQILDLHAVLTGHQACMHSREARIVDVDVALRRAADGERPLQRIAATEGTAGYAAQYVHGHHLTHGSHARIVVGGAGEARRATVMTTWTSDG